MYIDSSSYYQLDEYNQVIQSVTLANVIAATLLAIKAQVIFKKGE